MISFDSDGFKILALTIHWTAVFVVIGVWLAAELAALLSVREGQKRVHVWRGLIWVVLCSLIGARLWFVVFPPLSYTENGLTTGWLLSHFFDLNQGAVAIWAGGLGLFGGIIGGLGGLTIYTRRHKLPFLLYLDLAAVVLPLAQIFGRLGNGSKQDLYGPPINLQINPSWGMLVTDEAQRVQPYNDLARFPLDTTRFHPVWLYEALALIIIFVILLVVFTRYRNHYRDQLGQGGTALLYLISYGMTRFLLESLRVNSSFISLGTFLVNISQAMAGIAACAAAIMLWRKITMGRTRLND